MEVAQIVAQLESEGAFNRIVSNPLAQFGTEEAPFLGAEFLPEREVPQNNYREEGIKYRTVVANDGTRYSAVQKKQGVLTGSMQVELADNDIGSDFTGQDYDALLSYLDRADGQPGNRPTMEAVAQLTNWSTTTINDPMLVKNEVQRWQAMVDSQVIRTGDGGYYELVPFSNPAGHRVNAGGVWSSNAYDPYADITAAMEFMAAIGYNINRIVSSTPVVNKLLNNTNLKNRVGRIGVVAGTTIGQPGRLSLQALNDMFGEDGIPPIEKYDRTYRTQTGYGYYLRRNCMVLVATTGRSTTIDLGDGNPVIVPNTIGYTGIGRAAGQRAPGRVMKVRAIDSSKPPRIEGEGWQTSFPVIQEPEALFVIQNIS